MLLSQTKYKDMDIQQLEILTRKEIQQLAKESGVKANASTKSIIEKLRKINIVDADHPNFTIDFNTNNDEHEATSILSSEVADGDKYSVSQDSACTTPKLHVSSKIKAPNFAKLHQKVCNERTHQIPFYTHVGFPIKRASIFRL